MRNRWMMVELTKPPCPECGGDGSERRMFDANCPCAWAHQYLDVPETDNRTTQSSGRASSSEADNG